MCPDGFTGQPITKCTPFECESNSDCESDKKCAQGSCRDPCLEKNICGSNAQCRTENHEAACSCPPNTRGDPRFECQENRTHVWPGTRGFVWETTAKSEMHGFSEIECATKKFQRRPPYFRLRPTFLCDCRRYTTSVDYPNSKWQTLHRK